MSDLDDAAARTPVPRMGIDISTGDARVVPYAERSGTFTDFYSTHLGNLVGFLINQGATLVDATDIAQEAMICAYKRWSQIIHPKPWIYTVASRELIRRRVHLLEDPTDPPPASPVLRHLDVEYWEQRHVIVRALAKLPERQRQAMAWVLAGFTPSEIAEQLDQAPGTVRQTLHLARRKLVSILREEEGE